MRRVLASIFFLALLISLSTGLYFFYAANIGTPKNVLLIGWDGAERQTLKKMFFEGSLPNLKNIVDEGGFADIEITSGETETKPGWTEILTGYRAASLEIFSNKDYKPIPAGYTIFERLEEFYGPESIVTIFVTGKINNTGARGPHTICVNCLTRDPVTFEKTGWWDEPSDAPVKKEDQRKKIEEREGEPYYLTVHSLDFFQSGLGTAPNVGALALQLIEKYSASSKGGSSSGGKGGSAPDGKDQRFFMFAHFEEPDEPGHVFGGSSQEYKQGLIENDLWLGNIVSALKERGLYEKTVIYVVSDHGFDPSGQGHKNQPETFFATNDPKKIKTSGSRLDITPTILDRLDIDLSSITPALHGKSLYE